MLCQYLQRGFVFIRGYASLFATCCCYLQEFVDVFPQYIPPGLPPIRGIEHQIDLIPGASLPNHAPYRTNPEETKKIQ
jgi:hypothetical protein